MKKFTQVLEDDEKIRSQLEMLVSPTCSCKQAEGCVVRITLKVWKFFGTELIRNLITTYISEGNNKEVGQSKATNKSFPGND